MVLKFPNLSKRPSRTPILACAVDLSNKALTGPAQSSSRTSLVGDGLGTTQLHAHPGSPTATVYPNTSRSGSMMVRQRMDRPPCEGAGWWESVRSPRLISFLERIRSTPPSRFSGFCSGKARALKVSRAGRVRAGRLYARLDAGLTVPFNPIAAPFSKSLHCIFTAAR